MPRIAPYKKLPQPQLPSSQGQGTNTSFTFRASRVKAIPASAPSSAWILAGIAFQVAALAALAFLILSYTPHAIDFWKGHSATSIALTATLVAASLTCFRQGNQSKKLNTFLVALSCVAFLAMSGLDLSRLSWEGFLATSLPFAGVGALEYYFSHRKHLEEHRKYLESLIKPVAPSSSHYENRWMMLAVGPYKPMGSLPCKLQAQDPQGRLIYDSAKAPDAASAVEVLQQEVSNHTETFPDNRYVMERLPLGRSPENGQVMERLQYTAVNPDSLFALLKLNRAILTKNDTQQLLEFHLKTDNKEESIRLFMSHLSLMPPLLVDVALADPKIAKDSPAEQGGHFTVSRGEITVTLPKKGVADILQLQQKFPSHNWHTIRNFLVQFHRTGSLNPAREAEAMLKRVESDKGAIFYFENGIVRRAKRFFK